MKQLSDFFGNKTVQGLGIFIAIMLLALPYLSSMTGLLAGVQWQVILNWLRDPIWQTMLGVIAVLLAIPSVIDWWRNQQPPIENQQPPIQNQQPPIENQQPPIQNPTIPPPTYHKFVGRDALKQRVEQSLLETMPIVALVGMGGVGKTALAREVVTGAVIASAFATTTWLSAKKEEYTEDGKRRALPEQYELTFENLLNAVARQVQQPEIMMMSSDKKQQAIQQLLQEKRHLVVLDNLETVPAYQDIVGRLRPILGQSKALLTSRHYEQLGTVVKLIQVQGLPKDEARAFLRTEAERLGVESVLKAKVETLDQIHEAVEAMPLAMKLLVGQLQTKALDQMLTQLRDKRVTAKAIYDLYRYLFQTSWDLLTDPEQDLLISMAGFVQPDPGTLSDIRNIAKLTPADFDQALPHLVSLSLIDKVNAAGSERYGIHALTDLFVQSDITQETSWRET